MLIFSLAHLQEKKEDLQDGDDGEDAVIPAAVDAEFRDEAIYKPTLLIKTISPTVSRNQLEEVGLYFWVLSQLC